MRRVDASSATAAVGQRETELGSHELLDVGAAHVLGLGDLDDLEDLVSDSGYAHGCYQSGHGGGRPCRGTSKQQPRHGS